LNEDSEFNLLMKAVRTVA